MNFCLNDEKQKILEMKWNFEFHKFLGKEIKWRFVRGKYVILKKRSEVREKEKSQGWIWI